MLELKMSDQLLAAFNKQIQMELQSAYIYNGMRIYLKDLGLPGATHWMTLQTHEEIHHAEDFIDVVQELDEHVELFPMEKVKAQYDSPLAVWEAGLAHEKEITASILEMLQMAIEEKNYRVENFLRKYVDEQNEEEDHFRGIIDLFKMAGDDKAALFKVDGILRKRS